MEHDSQIRPSTPGPFTTSLVLAPKAAKTAITTTIFSRSGTRKVIAAAPNDAHTDGHTTKSVLTSCTSHAGTAQYELPWVEKYRPMVLDDITGNVDAIRYLKALAVDGNVPNLLLSGPPGTGKTTSIACLARALLGPAFDRAVLELNASDERGIDVVRKSIKEFARTTVNLPPGRHKMIILDEADCLTQGAQQALRCTMEKYTNTTRFALACNTSSMIIEALQSRCAILRYQRLADEQILDRLHAIVAAEKDVPCTRDGLDAIVVTADGDMRQAINNLQATHAGCGRVDADSVYTVCDRPHPALVRAVLLDCGRGDIDAATAALDKLWGMGYMASDIIGTMMSDAKRIAIDERLRLDLVRVRGLPPHIL
ncbi:Replication factor small subunit [Pandoravirus kuranda]|uniref:Replication factor small subunit n=1 Tax=Pandoravirus kuranda TaxID=3019033 RepID=A0AA95J2F8_9VIRU|nr:Replication factor small subunit [Pandoravirus kuranda]